MTKISTCALSTNQADSMTREMLKTVPYMACLKSVDIVCRNNGYRNTDDALRNIMEKINEIKNIDCLEERDRELFDAVLCANCVDNGEIIEFDTCFDNIISDTAVNIEDCVYLPFDLFFINKWFTYENKIMPGLSIGKLPEGTIAFTYISIDFLNDVVQAVFCGNVLRGLKNTDDEFKEVSKYVLNCINIINNPDKDIKEIERFPSHKKLDPTHRKYDPYARKTTYITVGGELKKYIGEYNKRREAVGHNPSFIVRGHWRHFRSPRYKNKQGQSRWIYPYIKGMPEELVHRFVKVVPGDSKK